MTAYGPPCSPMPARSTAHYLDKVWAGVRPLNSAAVASIRAALAVWRPAAVVAVTSAGSPVGRVLIKLLGKPGFDLAYIPGDNRYGWLAAALASPANLVGPRCCWSSRKLF